MITPAYLDRFSCIGENCEDNCCHDWLIHIDKTHYHKIKEAMSVNAEKQSLFKANVQLTLKNKSSNERYAHLVLDHQQQCGFLETNGLCGLQMHYPQNRLPEGCRSYPRKIFFNGLNTEIYGSLSCPEIARLCLLSEDAMEPLSKDEPEQFTTRYNHFITPNTPVFLST